MVYNYIMTKTEKLLLLLFVWGFYFLFFLLVPENKIRNLVEQNYLLLQCFCKEHQYKHK